jgi:hypothetical protein
MCVVRQWTQHVMYDAMSPASLPAVYAYMPGLISLQLTLSDGLMMQLLTVMTCGSAGTS